MRGVAEDGRPKEDGVGVAAWHAPEEASALLTLDAKLGLTADRMMTTGRYDRPVAGVAKRQTRGL